MLQYSMGLPVVKQELLTGLLNSELDFDEILGRLLKENPVIYLYIIKIANKLSLEASKSCLLLYKILEAQLECNELSDAS